MHRTVGPVSLGRSLIDFRRHSIIGETPHAHDKRPAGNRAFVTARLRSGLGPESRDRQRQDHRRQRRSDGQRIRRRAGRPNCLGFCRTRRCRRRAGYRRRWPDGHAGVHRCAPARDQRRPGQVACRAGRTPHAGISRRRLHYRAVRRRRPGRHSRTSPTARGGRDSRPQADRRRARPAGAEYGRFRTGRRPRPYRYLAAPPPPDRARAGDSP